MTFLQIIAIGILLLVNIFFFLMLAGGMLGASFGSPFIPTSNKILKKMIDLAEIKKGQKVFDLGCGDGRIIFASEEKGALCTGIEISPPVFLIAKLIKFCKRKKSKLILGNFFNNKDIFQADVIFLFLMPKVMQKFYQEIFPHLKKGTKIISHAFTIKNLTAKKSILRRDSGHAPIFLFVKE